MTGHKKLAALIACCLMGATQADAQIATLPKTPDSSGPQTAIPAPAPAQPDIPGGSSRNGIVRPPTTGSNTPVIAPPIQGNMPVIVPPGSTGTQSKPVPK